MHRIQFSGKKKYGPPNLRKQNGPNARDTRDLHRVQTPFRVSHKSTEGSAVQQTSGDDT